MDNIVCLMRHEFLKTLSRKSYLLTAFGFPVVAALILLGATLLQQDSSLGPGGGQSAEPQQELQAEGYVDHAGLIEQIGRDVPDGILHPYPTEEAASEALQSGEIKAYYVIPSDYVGTGNLIYVNPDYNALGEDTGQSWVMQRTIFDNLMGNDATRIQQAGQPMNVQVRPLPSAEPQRDMDDPLAFYLPYGAMMIFYAVLMTSSSLLLNSVTDEKSNRVVELLLLSVTPRQMLTGKILALGLSGLLQATLWLGSAYVFARLAGQELAIISDLHVPFSLVLWGILFFLLGYGVYASLMAGLGALVPGMKEASQATFLVIWPLILPMLLIITFVRNPNGPLAVGMSLFPLTAPVAMITRLAVGGVPLWQPALAAVILVGTVVLVIRAVARLFRAEALLFGEPLSARRFYQSLFGRTSPTSG
jgi:ABC-2 type transport system permease protein